MKKSSPLLIVFFNASVIVAGLHSPKGGSAKLLNFANQKKFTAVASDIIINEVVRHEDVISMNQQEIFAYFEKRFHIIHAPPASLINYYSPIVLDKGDVHVIASAKETDANFLVTLDKKHLLSIKNKIKDFQIVTPGELIALLE